MTLHVDGERRELPAGLDLAAYRVVQEALTNALKHGGGSADGARALRRGRRCEVASPTPARGAARRASSGGGHGLVGMRERVRVFGGELHTGPRPSGGFEVRARLPLQNEEERRWAASAGRDHAEAG